MASHVNECAILPSPGDARAWDRSSLRPPRASTLAGGTNGNVPGRIQVTAMQTTRCHEMPARDASQTAQVFVRHGKLPAGPRHSHCCRDRALDWADISSALIVRANLSGSRQSRRTPMLAWI